MRIRYVVQWSGHVVYVTQLLAFYIHDSVFHRCMPLLHATVACWFYCNLSSWPPLYGIPCARCGCNEQRELPERKGLRKHRGPWPCTLRLLESRMNFVIIPYCNLSDRATFWHGVFEKVGDYVCSYPQYAISINNRAIRLLYHTQKNA